MRMHLRVPVYFPHGAMGLLWSVIVTFPGHTHVIGRYLCEKKRECNESDILLTPIVTIDSPLKSGFHGNVCLMISD